MPPSTPPGSSDHNTVDLNTIKMEQQERLSDLAKEFQKAQYEVAAALQEVNSTQKIIVKDIEHLRQDVNTLSNVVDKTTEINTKQQLLERDIQDVDKKQAEFKSVQDKLIERVAVLEQYKAQVTPQNNLIWKIITTVIGIIAAALLGLVIVKSAGAVDSTPKERPVQEKPASETEKGSREIHIHVDKKKDGKEDRDEMADEEGAAYEEGAAASDE